MFINGAIYLQIFISISNVLGLVSRCYPPRDVVQDSIAPDVWRVNLWVIFDIVLCGLQIILLCHLSVWQGKECVDNVPLFDNMTHSSISCAVFFMRTLRLPTALSPDGVDTSNMIAFGNFVLPANQYLFMTREKCTFWTVFPQARVPTSWSNHYDTGTVSIYEYQFA